MASPVALNIEALNAKLLSAEELKLAASLLYQAYHDDPVFMDLFGSSRADYEKRLRATIREELNLFWQERQPMIGLFQEGQLLGVACVTEPNSAFRGERFWHWRLKMLLTAGYVSTKQLLEKEQRIHAALPSPHCHMLAFIAISPTYQHSGLGHYLMHAVDHVVGQMPDSCGVGVFVTLERNLKFFSDEHYQKITKLSFTKVSGTLMFRPKPLNVKEPSILEGV